MLRREVFRPECSQVAEDAAARCRPSQQCTRRTGPLLCSVSLVLACDRIAAACACIITVCGNLSAASARVTPDGMALSVGSTAVVALPLYAV